MPARSAQAAPRCFPETNQCLDGRIRQYWEQNGGLPVFGFPITAQAPELNRDTGQTYVTQWMERNRFELHPENAAPYDVLLGRLGDDRLRQLGIDWQTLPKANPSDPHYFPQTGQAITHEPFWQYWRSHGLELGDRGISERESLALFGYPISPARMETNSSGDTVLTQWFERARFEWHPNNPEPYKVLLGLLGNEVRAAASMPAPSPSPSPSPSPAPDPCANIAAPRFAYIEPNCVRRGEAIGIVVWGFEPNQEISYWVTRADGATVGASTTVRADEDGIFAGLLDTSIFPPGDYVFVAQDSRGEYEPSVAPFRILP